MGDERFELAPLDAHAKPQWLRPSKWFLAAIGISVVVLGLGLWLMPAKKAVISKRLPDTPSPFQTGLSLENTIYNPAVGPQRRIEGSIRNTTSEAQRNVYIVFRLGNYEENDIGEVDAMIPLIAPGQSASFRTKPIPEAASHWAVASLRAYP
jgi:hypothetical protein